MTPGVVVGHGGAKVLTRCASFHEYEDLGLVRELRDKLEHGHLQVFCLDTVDAETFYCSWRHPGDRVCRHLQYESYVLSEVLPLMAQKNTHPCTIAHGCSFGAYGFTTARSTICVSSRRTRLLNHQMPARLIVQSASFPDSRSAARRPSAG